MNLVKNSLTGHNLQPGASRGLPGGSGISRESAGFHLLSGPRLFPVGVSGEEFAPAGGGGDHPARLGSSGIWKSFITQVVPRVCSCRKFFSVCVRPHWCSVPEVECKTGLCCGEGTGGGGRVYVCDCTLEGGAVCQPRFLCPQ